MNAQTDRPVFLFSCKNFCQRVKKNPRLRPKRQRKTRVSGSKYRLASGPRPGQAEIEVCENYNPFGSSGSIRGLGINRGKLTQTNSWKLGRSRSWLWIPKGRLFHGTSDFPLIITLECRFGALICSWWKNQSAHEHKVKDGSSSAPHPCGYDNLCLEVERKAKTRWIIRIGLDGEAC